MGHLTTSNPLYLKYRNAHANRVIRDTDEFMGWYDKAAERVFSGICKKDAIDRLAPFGCPLTQSNGVQAGACQAARLMRFNHV